MSKAEEYSFNISSKLFQQLTKEQQVLWRKEIESAFNNGYHQAEKDLKEEIVSESLEEASVNYAATGEFLPNGKEMIDFQLEKAFKAGAKWQKEQMLSEEKK